MSFTGEENCSISFEEGAELTANYRRKPVGSIKGYYFSKEAIQQLLDQSDAVGIRAYFGRKDDSNNTLCLVIVGVSADENDQIGDGYACVDKGTPCPSCCGTSNILNS